MNAHYLEATRTNLTGLGQRAQNQDVFFDGALTWHINAANALRTSAFWQPRKDWLTSMVTGGEFTRVRTGTTMGAQASLETQLARAVTWHNRLQYMWDDQTLEPERCPDENCTSIGQMEGVQSVQDLAGWYEQSNLAKYSCRIGLKNRGTSKATTLARKNRCAFETY